MLTILSKLTYLLNFFGSICLWFFFTLVYWHFPNECTKDGDIVLFQANNVRSAVKQGISWLKSPAWYVWFQDINYYRHKYLLRNRLSTKHPFSQTKWQKVQLKRSITEMEIHVLKKWTIYLFQSFQHMLNVHEIR